MTEYWVTYNRQIDWRQFLNYENIWDCNLVMCDDGEDAIETHTTSKRNQYHDQFIHAEFGVEAKKMVPFHKKDYFPAEEYLDNSKIFIAFGRDENNMTPEDCNVHYSKLIICDTRDEARRIYAYDEMRYEDDIEQAVEINFPYYDAMELVPLHPGYQNIKG